MAWFETDKRRFIFEMAAVETYNKDRKPEFRIQPSRSADAIVLRVLVQPTVNLYRVRIALQDPYPKVAPRVVVEDPPLPPGTPHVLSGREPCLFKGVGVQPWCFNPAVHTGVFALQAFWRWALCHDLYLTTGRWAIPDAMEMGE